MGMPSEDFDGKLFKNASSSFLNFLLVRMAIYPLCRGLIYGATILTLSHLLDVIYIKY